MRSGPTNQTAAMLLNRLACTFLAACGAAAHGQPLTLDEAQRIAEQNHPLLRSTRSEVSATEAELQESKALLWNNPQLSAEARQRRLGQVNEPDVSRRDAALGISQTFETGGQPRARRAAAQAALEANQATVEATRREVRAETAQRYFQVLALQRRVQMEQEGLGLVQRAAAMVAKRVSAGEDSRLDGNLATVEAERSVNQLAQAREQLLQAQYALAATLQLPPGATPEASGDLTPPAQTYTKDELLSLAARHPKVQAAEARTRAASSRVTLEKAARAPDVTVGLSYSPERSIDTKDRVTTLSISVPLPLFRRNEGAVGRALSDEEKSRAEQLTTQRESAAAVYQLWQRQESLTARVARLRDSVLSKLDENQRLSLKALQAGEISLGQYLLVRRQALDAQRDVLDASAELAQTRSELETAAGWPELLPPIELLENNKK